MRDSAVSQQDSEMGEEIDPESSAQTESCDLSENAAATAHAEPAVQAQGKFVIRLPAGLLKQLSQISREHQRSMNTEINLLLGRYLEQQGLVESGPDDQQEPLDLRLRRKLSSMPAEKREALLQLLE